MQELVDDCGISAQGRVHILRQMLQMRLQGLHKRQVGQCQIFIATAIADPDSPIPSHRPHLVHEPRLADASLSRNEHHTRVASEHFLQAALHPGQLLCTADKGRESPHAILKTLITLELEWPIHVKFTPPFKRHLEAGYVLRAFYVKNVPQGLGIATSHMENLYRTC
jgi:hypothetical protein